MRAAEENRRDDALKDGFSASAGESRTKAKRKHPPPFSIRFTDEERAILDREAGKLSLAAHIRRKLFGEGVLPHRSNKPTRKPQRPSIDRQALGKALGELGKSRLASNMNQIAKAANTGALPVTPELVADLKAACADIRLIRATLMKALRIKPEDAS